MKTEYKHVTAKKNKSAYIIEYNGPYAIEMQYYNKKVLKKVKKSLNTKERINNEKLNHKNRMKKD